jgi:hypothetical protein
MSWHGPSAPRAKGIATKSRVVVNCPSKFVSTASRIFRCISPGFIASRSPFMVTKVESQSAVIGSAWIALRIAVAPIHFCGGASRPMEASDGGLSQHHVR